MAKTKNKKSAGRELIEWSVFFGVFIFLYASGLHTTVLGGIQGLFLKTGIMSPALLNEDDFKPASYQIPLSDLAGNPVDMAQFKGKTVFVNFWATWCPPCIAEMPEIAALYEEVSSNDDIVFLMISVDEEHEKLEKFVEKKQYDFSVMKLQGRLPQPYQEASIPRTYLISPSGQIVLEKIGMGSYHNESFKAILKETASL